MSVITKTRTVYFSSAANRHFMTRRAAVNSEASKLIERKYPSEKYDRETGPGWHWKEDDRLVRLHARLVTRIVRALSPKEQQP